MLDSARQRREAARIGLLRADLRSLPLPSRCADFAVAVNSILLPSETDILTILAEVRRILKPGGAFFGIFPSMDAILYYGRLVLHRELELAGEEEGAVRRAGRAFERRKYDLFRGIYDDGGERQKLFHSFELRLLLKRSGFGGARLSKVRYPWGEASGDFEDFPSEPPMWDWLVRAEAA
jgi:SAM-dependent methyltransferase